VLRQARLTESEPVPTSHPSIAIRQLASSDRVLCELISRIGDYQMRLNHDAWESFFIAVAYQQMSGAAAKRVCDRIRSRSGNRLPSPELLLEMPIGWLRQFGLTSRKETTLRSAAVRIVAGELDLDALGALPDQEVINLLTSIRGVGQWTACMFLVFHLGREDVILPGDLGVRRAIRSNYGLGHLPSGAEVEEKSAHWAPFRTIASWYLWKSLVGFPEPGLG
jgi:DNA-3-methyladenine glycosylase II